ncbi:MAG: PilT/PilU family type 4a pilus ATPase [Planctomycetes bacterium]|nr:PilT/PilU family type 4a pilus ATPase [Planctomycetota bacterium]
MSNAELDQALIAMLDAEPGVSDLNFTPGRPPQVEASGKMKPVELKGRAGALSAELTERIAKALMGGRDDLASALEEQGSCDCAYALPDGRRFRVNIFSARGKLSIVLRALPTEIPTISKLGLPPVLGQIAPLKNGLVLVTGATGSGKSTTLAAVLDSINDSRDVHVVTLEDPIEFVHPHKRATMNQREQGEDFGTFAQGLRAALRQAPKVILVGEMRDAETVEIALKAAETGHLVLSTLHTIDAGQTIQRIAGMFDSKVEHLVRARLAETLRFVVGQRLLPKVGGGRVAALEIMGTSLRIRELVQKGETDDDTFYAAISEGRGYGWQTFDQHIIEHFEADRVDAESALAYASDRGIVGRALDSIKAKRGIDTSSLGSLEMARAKKPPSETEDWKKAFAKGGK